MVRKCLHTYDDIISVENLLDAWTEFVRGKRGRNDVLFFERNLMHNIFQLHDDLKMKKYNHGGYQAFKISDPKSRDIHKASVRDRLIHHAIYRVTYSYFDKKFIHDSYSCRLDKGTHKGIRQFNSYAQKVSRNHSKTCWVLKCDIRKFFSSIDHKILSNILGNYIFDQHSRNLFEKIIGSFGSGIGLPLGNLTSQILVNIYMNEFDHFVKNELKEKYYIRYADDFVFLSDDKKHLEDLVSHVRKFMRDRLRLELHPNKLFIKTIASGVDFLGWVIFPDRRVVRTVSRRRMMKRIVQAQGKEEVVTSYLGMLSHGNGYTIKQKIDILNTCCHS